MRFILNFKTYSCINILSLAISLACVITIFRYVYGEFTVDRFNEHLDRIYVVTQERSAYQGNVQFSGISNIIRETAFADLTNHSGVERHAHFICFDNDEIDVDGRKFMAKVLAADSNFLKITDYPLISGVDRLTEPKSALITQTFAQKLFGHQNPVGKTFRHTSGEILTITGVIGQTTTKTTLSFDVVVSYYLSDRWGLVPQTFALLYSGVDYRTINKQYESFFDIPHPFLEQQIRCQLFPLSKVYFDKSVDNDVFRRGNYDYVTVLMAVGVLILLAGVISYINIFAVVVLRRGKELGIKRVFGAEGHNIFKQLLVENLLTTGLALILAFFIARAAYPFISGVLHLDQIFNIRFDMLLSFGILLSLPILVTLYPFFRYQYSMPVNSLRNFDKMRGGSLRLTFLSFQYMITMVMIVVSLFFIKQFFFMRNSDPGYRTKDIVKVQFLKQTNHREKWDEETKIADEIVQKMNDCPLFVNWTSGKSPNEFPQRKFSFKLADGDYQDVKLIGVDERWLRSFEIPLKEGRIWDDNTDTTEDYLMIVTESVLKLYGISDFNNVLLQPNSRLWAKTIEDMNTNPPYRIVGVMKDFDYLHLSQKPDPVVFCYSQGNRYDPLIASIVPGRKQDAIEFLRNLHEETVGGEFAYSFVDDEVREMYREDKKIASIYTIFTFIAIFISALGLFSMSLFDIKQRRREIAIRKVHGASVYDIIRLLLKKYFWALSISFVIAAPVALFAINRYLEDFANKAPVSWWLFAIALTVTAGISLVTLIYQTQKAASQNPSEVMKN